ncbi:CpsD/CapB family tyrosine-protein kinase [Eubacteriales bacterium mix99]
MKVLLVTSAAAAEGKSTTASNLAITMAQTGKKVLLVDCDLRKPSVNKAFNLPNGEGLTNVLADALDYHEVCKYISGSDLEILTCGPKPPDPSELLGSKRMEEFIQKASAECDMVILDAPPVLPVTDSVVLSQLVDGIVIVLSYGKTTNEMALQAKESLKKVGANILGAVINNIPEREHSHNGHGYYYGYAEDSRSKRRKPRLMGVREKAGRRSL